MKSPLLLRRALLASSSALVVMGTYSYGVNHYDRPNIAMSSSMLLSPAPQQQHKPQQQHRKQQQQLIKLDIDRQLLGAGSFGLVKRATEPKTGHRVAVKLILKDNPRLQHEIDVLNRVNECGGHDNIVKFYGLAKLPPSEAKKHVGLVFELFQGGELYDHLVANGAYSEAKASLIIHQLASALAFLHKNGICHGDVKPENVLLRNANDENLHAALCDFGSAMFVDSKGYCGHIDSNEPLGTVGYSAPEMLCRFDKKHPCKSIDNATTAMDIFSLGTMLYIILSGEFPFDPDNELKSEDEIAGQILKCEYDFDERLNPVWASVSEAAKCLIRRMMMKDPAERITAGEILEHDWIAKPQREEVIEDSDVRLAAFLKAQKRLRDHFFRMILVSSIRDGLRHRENLHSPGMGDLEMRSYLRNLVESFDVEHKGYLDSKDFMQRLDGYTKEEETEASATKFKFFYSNLNNLLGCGQRVHYKPNEVICREGDVADAFYFVDCGTVDVTWREGEKHSMIGTGEFFGEISLMRQERRIGTAVAGKNGVELIRFTKEEFDKFIVGGSEETRKLMADAASLRMIQHAKSVFSEMFQDRANTHIKNKGVLIQRGDMSDSMYLITRGVVDVLDANGVVVVQRGEGDTVGELGLIANAPRSMTIVCSSEQGCEFKRLTREDLRMLLASPRKMMRDEGEKSV